MASTPRPGTSFDVHNNNNFESVSSPVIEEVDTSILEVESPGLTRLLKDNGLRIVSRSCSWNKSNNDHDKICKKLNDDVRKLNEKLSTEGMKLAEANQRISRQMILMIDKDRRLKELEENGKREVEELKRKLHETEGKLKNYENRVKDLELKQDQTSRNFTAEKIKRELIEKEKADVERQRSVEKIEFQKKLQEEKSQLETKYQEDRLRRRNEIIALKNEKERLTAEQFRFKAFVRNLSNWSEIRCEDDSEILSVTFLEHLSSEMYKRMEKCREESGELLKNRDLLRQLENLFFASKTPSTSTDTTLSDFIPNTSSNLNVSETRRHTGQISSSPFSNAVQSNAARPSFSSDTPPTSPDVGTLSKGNQKRTTTVPTSSPSSTSNIVQKTMETSPQITIPNEPPILGIRVPTATTLPASRVSSSPGQSLDGHLRTPSNVSKNTSVPSPLSASPPPSIVIPLISPSKRNPPLTKCAFRDSLKPLKSRKYRQFTEFVISSKRHGVKLIDKASQKFICLCEKDYKYEKGLKVHIRKMTKPWKYRCTTCKEYFFQQCDLKRHSLTNRECAGDSENFPGEQNSVNGSVNAMLNDYLQMSSKRCSSKPCASSSTTTKSNSIKVFNAKRNVLTRKLQQEILRRKKHAPWLSMRGSVQGSWMCVCGSKFTSKPSLCYHVDYYTKDWKFKCPHCHQKFFCLGYLKKHMSANHKIPEPFKQYSVGCHLCGRMFNRRTEYYKHRKTVHNLHVRTPAKPSGLNLISVSVSTSLPAPPTVRRDAFKDTINTLFEISSDEDEEIISPTVIPLSNPTSANVMQNCSSIPPMPFIPVVEMKKDVVDTSIPSLASVCSQQSTRVENNNSDTHSQRGQRHAPLNRVLFASSADPQRQHICTCGNPYKSRTALNHHIKTMKYGCIYVCLQCSRGFKQRDNLKSHMSSIHKTAFTGFECGLCRNQFCANSYREFKLHCLAEHH